MWLQFHNSRLSSVVLADSMIALHEETKCPLGKVYSMDGTKRLQLGVLLAGYAY
jgi:hypothetical protein